MDIKRKIGTAVLGFVMAVAMTVSSYASTSYDMRKKVVNLAGITSENIGPNEFVTREQFARMVAMASTYSSMVSNNCSVSVYPDVLSTNEYASSILLCASNGWMTAGLGGLFKPTDTVSLYDAEKALLGLLGYSDNDFAGDVVNKRSAKAISLSLTENVNRNLTDSLTFTDCVNMFYNLMRCNTAQGKAYASVLGGSLSADGEVNALGMVDNSLKGPKFITDYNQLENWIPFDLEQASVYIDGEADSRNTLTSIIGSEGSAVYYSSKAKTIWAYSIRSDTENTGKGAYRGNIDSIVYQSADTLTPSGVIVDGTEFKLGSSDMQFAFSIYGTCKVGETITLIFTKTSNGVTPSVIDYIYE